MTEQNKVSDDSERGSFDQDEALARFAENFEAGSLSSETLDYGALAREMGVPLEDLEDCLVALNLMNDALDHDDTFAPVTYDSPTLSKDYELLDELGRGGMGVVYRARQRSLDREVAIKVLRPGENLFGDMIQRFEKEAKTLARLRHRHIVSIYEVGETEGHTYFSMDFIQGQTLSELIRAQQITPTRAALLLRQVASAISYAHGQGIIHRDLKPGNVLVNAEGHAFVVDFGLARDLAVPGDRTSAGHILGTPVYMSPEQANGQTELLGEGTDIYALGVMLYECLSGQVPFRRSSLMETLQAVIDEDPSPPSRINPRIPRDLEIICLKAMSKPIHQRYLTAQAMLEDLEHFEAGRPIRARRPSLTYRLTRFAQRQRQPLLAALTVLAALSFVFWLFIMPRLGRTPEELIQTSNELWQSGQKEAALTIFELVPRSSLSSSERRDFDRHLLRRRMTVAQKLKRQNETEQAVEILRRAAEGAEELLEEKSDGAILWDLMQCYDMTGEQEKAKKILLDLEDAHRARHGKELLFPKTGEAAARYWNSAFRGRSKDLLDILDRMFPALVDKEALGHKVALRYLSYAIAEDNLFTSEPLSRWILSKGDLLVPVIVELLFVLPDHKWVEKRHAKLRAAVEGFPTLRRVAEGFLGSKLAERLVREAEREGQEQRVRTMCVELLCANADLPFQFTKKVLFGWQLLCHEELEADALKLWRQIQQLPPLDAFRQKIEVAVARQASVTDDNSISALSDWLKNHLGSSFPANGDWQDWWKGHRQKDPRLLIVQSLGLPSLPAKSDLRSILDHWFHSKNERDWILYHRLLSLSVSSELMIANGLNEDEAMGFWKKELGEPNKPPPHWLRIAQISMPLDGSKPVLEKEERFAVNFHDYSKIHMKIPVEETDTQLSCGAQLAGFGYRKSHPTKQMVMTGLILNARLERREGKAFLKVSEVVAYGPGSFSGGSGPSEEIGYVFPINEWEINSDDLGTPLRMTLSLAIVESPSSESKPWTVDRWHSKIIEDLSRRLNELEDRAARPLQGRSNYKLTSDFDSLLLQGYPTSMLAQWPSAKAAPLLKRFRRFLSSRSSTFAHVKSHDCLPGLILAGDESCLANSKELETLSESLSFVHYKPVFWVRVLLKTKSSKVRDLAFKELKKLKKKEFLESLKIEIERAIREQRLDAPDWFANDVLGTKARSERERLWMLFKTYFIVGAFVCFLLLTLIMTVYSFLRSSHNQRSYLALLLIFVGLIFVSANFDVNTWDFLPEFLGYTAMTLGAWGFVQISHSRIRFVSLAAFALAFVTDSVGRLGDMSILLWLSALFCSLGIFGLYFQARILERESAIGRTGVWLGRFFLAFYVFPALAFHTLSILGQLKLLSFSFKLEGGAGTFAFCLIQGGLLMVFLQLLGILRLRQTKLSAESQRTRAS